jgi:hypothetical protein
MTPEQIKQLFPTGYIVYSFDGNIQSLQDLFVGRGINTVKVKDYLYFIVVDSLPIIDDPRVREI